jgi:hypothetical protein
VKYFLLGNKKMELPLFFCVENESRFKVYMNTRYKSEATSNKETCVLWPQDNIVARTMTLKLRDSKEKTTICRKWNVHEYEKIKWSFTGASIDMSLNDRGGMIIICPVVKVSDRHLLPFNCCSIVPSNTVFKDERDTSYYGKSGLYTKEPNSREYLTPIPPRVNFTYTAVSSNPVLAPVKAVRKSLPAHVANIVLSDAISKNEVCPISSEPITKETGTVTSCGHVFCKESIDQWLSIKNECPVCKQSCV